ncbi:MAG: ParB N-terminal domain-containing protein [Gemmata sp.]
MPPVELRALPLRDLKPAPYHPRRVLAPKSVAYRKLKSSIAAFGLVEPLVWNETTGHLVGGHARLPVLAELGLTEVPVSVVRLGEAREKALNVVLNNPEAQGRYDPSKLAALLTELAGLPELEPTGFRPAALAALKLAPARRGPVPQAEAPPERVEVTLVADAATYAALAPALDKLVGDYALVAHLRRA